MNEVKVNGIYGTGRSALRGETPETVRVIRCGAYGVEASPLRRVSGQEVSGEECIWSAPHIYSKEEFARLFGSAEIE